MGKEELQDWILITEKNLELEKKQRDYAQEYCEEFASIMGEIKTDSAKKELSELTQQNYTELVKMDIRMGLLEKALKMLKKTE